jgi:hypothetical protein
LGGNLLLLKQNGNKKRSRCYMKKQILLTAFVVITTMAMAQIKPSFGVRAGVVSSAVKGDAVNNLESTLDLANGMITTANRTGFFAGGYASIPVSNILSVEPGLYYSQKGYQLAGSFSLKGLGILAANARANLRSDYIDVPVLLKANFDGFQIFGGPQVSYLVNSNLNTRAGALGINLLNRNINATSLFNKWDAAFTGGLGYKFSNGFNVTASYDHGFSRVDANRSVNSYNRVFKLGVGFEF